VRPQGPPENPGHPRWLGPATALLIFGAVAWLLHRELAHFHVRNVLAQLHAIPREALLAAFGFMAASYLALGFYDVLALAYLRKHVPFLRVLSASFIANAFGHNLGFAAFTGAAFRLRLYASSRLTATGVATVTGFTSVTTTLGLAVLAGTSFLAQPEVAAAALHTVPAGAQLLGSLLLAAAVLYYLWSCSRRLRIEIRGWLLRPPGARLGAAQIALGTVDTALACAVLWMVLPQSAGVSYVGFVGVFAIAVAAGLVSHVPGGLGVFEAIIVFAVPNVAPDALLGSLLAYRSIYYLTPLLFATLLFAAEEVGAQRARLGRVRRRAAEFIAPAVPAVGGALTFVAGAVLLFAGATPAVASRLGPLARVVPLMLIELAHLAASLIGLALLVLSRALFRRSRTAYLAGSALLCLGALAALLKGMDYEQAAFLLIVLAVLVLGRRAFYRPAAILQQRFTPSWAASIAGVIIASIWIGFLAYRHVPYSHQLWWTFGIDASVSRMLRASFLVSVLGGVFLLVNVVRPPARVPAAGSTPDLARLARVIGRSDATLANAALTGDKLLLFSDSGDAFIMYQVQGRSWIALGDPVGPPEESEELVWRFREIADEHGGRVAFYQTRTEWLSLYVDLGLAAMKIGEEARVALAEFTLEASIPAELREVRRGALQAQASFEVLAREAVAGVMPALRAISQSWLRERAAAEKGFSVGTFSGPYLARFPLALVRVNGEPVAFANLWSAASREELAVDLLRIGANAPPGTMDFLLLELMLWARTQGYRWFSLGMAPLAGLDQHPLAPAWQRIGNFIFRHGEHFANFEGLRRYMACFRPVWEPRYLVAAGGVALPRILLDVSALIAGGASA